MEDYLAGPQIEDIILFFPTACAEGISSSQGRQYRILIYSLKF